MNPSRRRQALEGSRLYLVAPGSFPIDALRSVIESGVDLVQLRMKDAQAAEVLDVGMRFRAVCEEANVLFVVNDRPDIALALGADGVHLGQEDLPPAVAREIVGPDVLIGRSTHSLEDISGAQIEHEAGAADYIAVGPVWETPTAPGKSGVGLGLVEEASRIVAVPWFAIGGVDASNVAEVRACGARRIVVVRAIIEAADPAVAASALRREME